MASPAFVARLNEQLGYEFGAHQQYVAIAAYYDALTMPQMAGLFYQQATEERDHAMMMIQYLLDADAEIRIPALEAPEMSFADVIAPVKLALDQEKRVTDQINELTLGVGGEGGRLRVDQPGVGERRGRRSEGRGGARAWERGRRAWAWRIGVRWSAGERSVR